MGELAVDCKKAKSGRYSSKQTQYINTDSNHPKTAKTKVGQALQSISNKIKYG